ncbi:MAG: F0F1 ATP synthase subunit gamma [Clostridiales bacterium]|nr:F0F1 ATP synthase subunit gamma [Clostridiales bacterium]
MNVKAVVKVMNFHALLRVESSGRQALMYSAMEEELSAMMRVIQSNRNLQLDKRILLPDESLPVLRIYMGSDLGFCGSVNTSVSSVLMKDDRNEKIVVGRKLRRPPEVSLLLTREEYEKDFDKVRAYLERAVRERCWSAVELVYNHYYNVSSVKQEIKRIYPLSLQPEEELKNQWDDFEIEGDAQKLLEDMTVSCLVYEVRIAAASAYAAENIMRQNATSESLKKLDEMEAEELRQTRKEKNQSSFRKTIDSYVKQKSLRR